MDGSRSRLSQLEAEFGEWLVSAPLRSRKVSADDTDGTKEPSTPPRRERGQKFKGYKCGICKTKRLFGMLYLKCSRNE